MPGIDWGSVIELVFGITSIIEERRFLSDPRLEQFLATVLYIFLLIQNIFSRLSHLASAKSVCSAIHLLSAGTNQNE